MQTPANWLACKLGKVYANSKARSSVKSKNESETKMKKQELKEIRNESHFNSTRKYMTKTTPNHRNGLLADATIQCIHPETKATGSWLFTAGNHREIGTSVSPVFGDIAKLYAWANQNGWRRIGSRFVFHSFLVDAQ